MKNLLVANVQNDNHPRYSKHKFSIALQAQIENSLNLGWKKNDIIILSNFDFEYMGVKAIVIGLNDFCFTGSKMFAIKWYFENSDYDGVIWCRDVDTWQNVEFDKPKFKHVGITTYSQPKLNGGSVFWRSKAKDIIDHIVDILKTDRLKREEPTLNKVLKSKEYKKRVTIINQTFNLGCSGFVKRYNRSDKPIRVCHFHPTNRIAWETHTLDRNHIGEIPVSKRLENIIRKYYKDLPTTLKDGGKKVDNIKK